MTATYYYTDPLEAAYMVKHFNFKMQDHNVTSEDSAEKICSSLDDLGYGNGKIYIDPSYHEMLKPQAGDKDEDGYMWMPKRNQWVNPLIVINWEEERTLEHAREESIIAKRNGKAFFMPETK